MLNISEDKLVGMLQNEKNRNEAFSLLVKEYSEQLYWQIRKIVISHDDANDVLQNTFIKVWTNLDNFRGESKLLTWLYKIATNESITFLNKQRSQNNIPIDDADNHLSAKLESDPYFDGDEAQLILQKAVLLLPEKQRLVFNMKYFEEMKYEEISEILDTSVGALKASYHHAVKKIEEYLSALD
ncbi:RNA polymerase sigma factor [Viscerimonas tarda]